MRTWSLSTHSADDNLREGKEGEKGVSLYEEEGV